MIDQKSSQYKKARRQYLKSVRNRPSSDSLGWTAFRAAEKRYKARFPPPDLSNVLDLALLDDELAASIPASSFRGVKDALQIQEVPLRIDPSQNKRRKAYRVEKVPGVKICLFAPACPHLTNHLVKVLSYCRVICPLNLSETSLDGAYRIMLAGQMKRIWISITRYPAKVSGTSAGRTPRESTDLHW